MHWWVLRWGRLVEQHRDCGHGCSDEDRTDRGDGQFFGMEM